MPTHLLLTANNDQEKAQARVRQFFAKNFLVKYDRIVISEARTIAGDHSDFWPLLLNGIAENRRVVEQLLAELRESGFHQLADLADLSQGYESKVLHIVTHLLDGFFGIDSRFYNLEEDAHLISDRLARAIHEKPRGFWLVAADCDIGPGHDANQLSQIRKFDLGPPQS